jgi:hypothetical protein
MLKHDILRGCASCKLLFCLVCKVKHIALLLLRFERAVQSIICCQEFACAASGHKFESDFGLAGTVLLRIPAYEMCAMLLRAVDSIGIDVDNA